jgi:phosphatidylglycerol:prolipoprotein diacylglycerol transferase
MLPVLFHIKLSWINSDWSDLPIYGYGLMLFFAFIFCVWLARRLCKREGIDDNLMPDLAIWLFVSGIIGGRIVFVATEWHNDFGNGFEHKPLWDIVKLWDGGLVLYGALFGAAFGFFGFYYFVMRKQNVSNWKMIDVIAPCIALGIALGRIGCLFTGCCYGNVACTNCPAIHFPLASPPTAEMIRRGYQTPLGFIFEPDSLVVEAVEPGSAADRAGLRAKDEVVEVKKEVEGERKLVPVHRQSDIDGFGSELAMTVSRDGKDEPLPSFEPRSIGLNPTQIYETISMCLLMFFLLSFYPYKRHDGEVMILLMIGYAVHRFLNEMLRTDTDPVALGMTLSQNISLGILAMAAVLAVVVWRRQSIGATSPVPSTVATPQG